MSSYLVDFFLKYLILHQMNLEDLKNNITKDSQIDSTELGVEAWDGSAKGYVDTNSITYKTTINGSSNKILNCDGTDYWQVGLTTLNTPC